MPGFALRSHASVIAELAEAEQSEGWLARCEAAGRYVALNVEFVESLARVLLDAGPAPVIEVCAGDGSLAEALRGYGVKVIATDVHPPLHTAGCVEQLAASEALQRYHPNVVLGSFVPVDAGVDRQVLDCPDVRAYLVLNARLGGELGARCLWTHANWSRTPLEQVTSWMVSRHDVWLGPRVPTLRHGEAWMFTRADVAQRHPPSASPAQRVTIARERMAVDPGRVQTRRKSTTPRGR